MPAGDLPLTIAEPGKLPPARFKNADDVKQLASKMIGADSQRAAWRAHVDGIWGGNPTYTLEKLKASNQAWRARVNYREMEGLVSSEQTMDYDLETQVESLVDISLDYGEGQDQRDWEEIIACEFTWLLKQRWPDYNFHTQYRIHQKLLHGIGYHIWPTLSGNWIPRTPRSGSIYFPEGCPLNFQEDGDYFMMRDFVPASSVYRWIDNEKAATDQGWNVPEVWKALAWASTTSRNTGNQWLPDQVQRSIRDGDIGWTNNHQSGLWLNYVFVKEFATGKISQYIVCEGYSGNGYLFEKRNRFPEWMLTMFPYDIGQGTIHSVKGLGARTKDFFELANRVRNAMADQVMLSAYPHFKQLQPNLDPDKLKLTRAGAMTISPYGLEEIISKYPGLDQGPLAFLQDLNSTLRKNNRGTTGGNEIEAADRMTGSEFMGRSLNADRLNNGSVALQRSCLGRYYGKMLPLTLKRSSSGEPWAKMAREMQDRILRKGVPKEAFDHIAEVRAVVSNGKGSAAAQLQSLMTVFQTVYPVTTEDRKIAIERDLVAALFGYDSVNRYARSLADQDEPTGDDSFAVQETDNLMQGGEALAAPRQDHVRHLQQHFGAAFQMAQAALQQQGDPQQAFMVVQKVLAHGEQHLKYLQTNPTKKLEFKELYNQFQELTRLGKQLESLVQDLAEATPPEQQVSETLQIGMAKVNAKAELDKQKQAHKEEIDWRKLASNERLKGVATLQDQQRKSAQTGADIQLSSAKTVSDILNQRAKTRSTTTPTQ